MKHLNYYLQIGFWLTIVTVWMAWLRQRMEIFNFFVDFYKNVGYIVDTNTFLLTWHLVISIAKLLLVVVILYRIIPRYGFRKMAVFHSIGLMLILQGLEWGYCRALFGLLVGTLSGDDRMEWNYNGLMNLQIYALFAIGAWVISAAYHWLIEYQNLRTLRQDQKSYIQLKEQLNPHFIFNALNNLYELALREEHTVLQEGILDFTETLRYTIDYSNKAEVSLSKEIEAIESFISLQKHRMDADELELHTRFQYSDNPPLITPLVLMNYVENAFKHGFSYGKPSTISIEIKEDNGQVQLTIKNTNHANSSNTEGGNKKNLALLDLNYPNKYKLQVSNTKEFYRLELWIDLNSVV